MDKAPAKILYSSASGTDTIEFTKNMHGHAAAGLDEETSSFVWCLGSLTLRKYFGQCYRFIVGTDTSPQPYDTKLSIGNYVVVNSGVRGPIAFAKKGK